MATLRIKGQPAEHHAKNVLAEEMDGYALARWGGVAMDLFTALSEYVPLRERLGRMEDWLAANADDPRWPDRTRQASALHNRILAPLGLFDGLEPIVDRLRMAHRQLSEAAAASLAADYGVELRTPDLPFFLAVMRAGPPADVSAFLDAWSVAVGGNKKEWKDETPCPF